jgi:hypothetical protein
MRQRIVDRVEAMGPCAIRDLAVSLDVAADSLYYHVRRLQRIGLLAVGSRRQAGTGRREAVVRLRGRWHIAYELEKPRNAEAVRAVGRTIVRQAQRDFTLGLEHPRATPRGPLRNLWALRLEASLKASDVRRINRHLAGILQVLRGAPRDGSEGLMAVSWVLAPIPSRRNGRRGPARPKHAIVVKGAKRSGS